MAERMQHVECIHRFRQSLTRSYPQNTLAAPPEHFSIPTGISKFLRYFCSDVSNKLHDVYCGALCDMWAGFLFSIATAIKPLASYTIGTYFQVCASAALDYIV